MALNRYEECAKCIGNSLRNVWDMNDRINDSALVTEHDIAVTAVNSSHVKFLHATTHNTLETSYIHITLMHSVSRVYNSVWE